MLPKQQFQVPLVIRGGKVRGFQSSLGVYLLLDLTTLISAISLNNKVYMTIMPEAGELVELGGYFEGQEAKFQN